MSFDVGSLAGGIGAIGSSIAGAISSSKNTKRMIRYQQDENERMRQYNKGLAEQQNAWNIAQWERENQYNRPSEQMARLKSAGINPDMMYGSGSQMNLSSRSPELTAGAPASPVDYSPIASQQTFGGNMLQSAGVASIVANTMKTRAETKKLEAETSGQHSTNEILATDSSFRSALLSQELSLNDSTIKLNESMARVNEQQLTQLRASVEKLNRECEVLDLNKSQILAHTENLDSQTAKNYLDMQLNKGLVESQIRKLSADTHLSYAHVKDILKTLSYRIANISGDTVLKGKESVYTNQKTITEIQKGFSVMYLNDRLQFDLQQDRDFQSVERSLGIGQQIVDILRGVLGTSGGAPAPSKVTGFGK